LYKTILLKVDAIRNSDYYDEEYILPESLIVQINSLQEQMANRGIDHSVVSNLRSNLETINKNIDERIKMFDTMKAAEATRLAREEARLAREEARLAREEARLARELRERELQGERTANELRERELEEARLAREQTNELERRRLEILERQGCRCMIM